MKDFGPLSGCRRKEARVIIPCITQARFSFKYIVKHDAPDVVKVDGFDFDVGKESVLTEQQNILRNGSRGTCW